MTGSQDKLAAWVRRVSEVGISFNAPQDEPANGPQVGLYPLELRGDVALSLARPDFRQLELSYLVTISGADSADAEALLVDLCFAAMDEPGMDVELAPPGVALWQALGIAPRPCFRVNVAQRRAARERAVRPVMHPLVVEAAGLGSIAGIVRTPDATAVPDARVEIASLGRTTLTDRAGRFRLDGVPEGKRPVRIRVSARGRNAERDVGTRDDRSFVVITINPVEVMNG